MERKDNTFVLFKKDKKTEKQPDYSGSGKINGVDVELAVWSRISEKGTEYFSGVFKEVTDDRFTKGLTKPKLDNSDVDIDDDIPW